MSAFLRGARVALHATDAHAPAGPDAWWDAGPRADGHDEILLEARDATTGAGLGVIGLTAIDWIARRARLCGGGPGLQGDAAREAVALVARYAFDELNLDRVEATPAHDGARDVLQREGFHLHGPGRLHALGHPRGPGTH